MQCPSCGAPIQAEQRYGHFHVCPFCQAASVIDGVAARLSGRMAVLATPRGPLAVDAEGTLEGRGFRVVGRVRHGHPTGYWDEWYLAFDDGETGWISEDEGELWAEEAHGREAAPELEEITGREPGDSVPIAGADYVLTEHGVATVEGGEGQLPEPLEPGSRFRYVDLRSATDAHTATIEIDLDGDTPAPGSARVFTGRPIEPTDLEITVPGRRGDELEAERSAAGDDRRRVVKRAGRAQRIGCDACGADLGVPEAGTTELTCTSCGTAVDLGVDRVDCSNCSMPLPIYGGDRAGMVTCRHCGAQLEHRAGDLSVLQLLAGDVHRPRPPIPLGRTGRVGDVDWRVVGHLRMVQHEDGERYYSDEQLLWSPRRGYAWLVHEDGHFSLCQELRTPPRVTLRQRPRKARFRYGERSWRLFEKGTLQVDHVDGELSWVAQVGDRVRYADAISPPYLLSEEVTLDADGAPREVEWSRSLYVERDRVAQAFDVPVRKLPRKRGVAPHQPFRQAPFWRESAWVMAALALVNLLLLMWAATHDGAQLARFQVAGEDYAAGWLSPPFEITDADGVLAATARAPVDNAWVYLQAALVDADSQGAVQDLDFEVSYYHGYDGGEHWSEGSREETAPFRAPRPGRYHLLVQGNGGYGNTGTFTPQQLPTIQLRVHEGVVLARFFAAAMVICLLWCAAVWVPRLIHEGQRWSDE